MVTLITDSGCDISQEEGKKLGIKILPILTLFGEETYRDGIDISGEDFYKKLVSSKVFPHTAQINAYTYEEALKEEIEKGNDVLIITLSSKLSGCYQSAMLASESYRDKVSVFDSQNVSMGQAALVYFAHSLLQEGKSREEVVNALETKKSKVKVFALLDTLEYLKRGGRIAKTTAFLGELLGIKPIVTVINGEVKVASKAKGLHLAAKSIKSLIEKSGGVDDSLPLLIASSGDKKDEFMRFTQEIGLGFETKSANIHLIGATIGTHVGPNAKEIAYFQKG